MKGCLGVPQSLLFIYIYFFFIKRWRTYESVACCDNTHGGLGRYNIAPLRATALLSLVVVVVYNTAAAATERLFLTLCPSLSLSLSVCLSVCL